MGHRVLSFGPVFLCVACAGSPEDSGDTDLGVGDSEADTDMPVEGCLAEPMALTPGTGAESFQPLLGGEEVTIWHGPQGGWHIDTAGEAIHSPQNVSILSVVTAIDLPTPVVIAGGDGAIDTELKGLVAYDDQLCSGQFWGVRAFVDDIVPPMGSSLQEVICTLGGQQLEIAITVSEIALDGATTPPRSVTSSVIVTAANDPVVDDPVCN